jgi:hypothetical protein
MNKFSSDHRFPGFIWLATLGQKWVARGRVSADLLGPHDAALAAVDADPHNTTAAVKWMDACDRIAEKVDPILDRSALQASLESELRKRGEERALDHFLSPRRAPRP